MDLKERDLMPSINKIRLTNVIYEEGNKRYNDELFLFDGNNGAILLENGGGKTVFIQTALQAILPHTNLADRKIKDTLQLEDAPAHIAIEWILNERLPRQYVVTVVSLFMTKNGLDSLRYVYDYQGHDPHSIENIPFVKETNGKKRTADRGEMLDYYSHMRERSFRAKTFETIKDFRHFIEENYHIISSEWENIVKINSTEGGVEAFFDECKSTNQLFDRLLIPTVEDSIEGFDKTNFADLFEQQRENFKAYKDLKESLLEYERIQTELEIYVDIYERLNEKELNFVQAKQRTKGVWEFLESEKRELDAQIDENAQKFKNYENDEKRYQYKKDSYELHLETNKLKELEDVYRENYALFSEKEEDVQKTDQYYFSLKRADYAKQIKEHEEKHQLYKEELKQMDQSEEAIDVEEQLEETRRALLGFYLGEIERLQKEKRDIRFQLRPILQHLEGLEDNLKKKSYEEKQIDNELSAILAKIDMRERDLNSSKNELLANVENENLRSEFKKWNERIQFLDETLIDLNQKQKHTQFALRELEDELDKVNTSLAEHESEAHAINQAQTRQREAHKTLLEKLGLHRAQWLNLDDLYPKENSILSTLQEEIQKYERERETLRHQERLAFRFVDDYADQDLFFSDPFIEKRVVSWKNQLDFIVTGTEYLDNLSESDRKRKANYPLWPLTLITTERSKSILVTKIQEVTDKLQFPISLLTIEEASAIGQASNQALAGEINEHNQTTPLWISPKHWQDNLETTHFSSWKRVLLEKAGEAKERREAKEEQISTCRDLLKEVERYLRDYPYENVAQIGDQLTSIKEILEKLQHRRKQMIELKRSHLEDLETWRKEREISQDEKTGLERKVEKAAKHFQLEAEIKQFYDEKRTFSETLVELRKQLRKILRDKEAYQKDKEELERRENELNFTERGIEGEESYKQVQTLTPIYSGESKAFLLEKIQSLNYQLREISKTRNEVVSHLNHEKETIQSIRGQIQDLDREHDHLDLELSFPTDGKSLLIQLVEKRKALKSKRDQLGKAVEETHNQKLIQEGQVQSQLKHFYTKFGNQEPMSFNDQPEQIAQSLKTEKHKLKETHRYLVEENSRLDKQMADIDSAVRELEKFIEGYHFNAPEIEPIPMDVKDRQAFIYGRKGKVSVMVTALKECKAHVEKEQKQVEKGKRHFQQFCQQAIRDVKMRKMAMDGVEYKQSYEDILAFKYNMTTSIEKASRYANEHIRQKDVELQAFINQIHHHLRTVVEELAHIPKKTKVKVENDWKQIFSFSIPTWPEELGKVRIREYIEWIITQLESDRFISEEGKEDGAKVRREVEMWLQSKQLIQMVMNNEVMKVTCRKVTNESKVSSRSYTWEQSNIWSGGEKWSKNMTLFLGILNYVAEKKQHIQTNMKRHRAVILDNPFGKASSDHVLSPVFFIAEQLGFQIIALTAHAEGKFLQDYFPIIYSCRLRPSQDPSKQIMTKDKHLHHAYFQDHDPESLERLTNTTQLELF